MFDAKEKSMEDGWAFLFSVFRSRYLKKICKEWLLPSQDLKRRAWPIFIGLGYIALICVLGGLKADHILIGSLCLLDCYNEKSRQFLRCFFPFILTGVVYDFMRYFYWAGIQGHIHVAEPYFRDLSWFGIPIKSSQGIYRVTPNEYFQKNTSVLLDLACGFAYLVFVTEYLCAAFFLFFQNHLYLLKKFGWCFFFVNLFGFVTYFIYPAAPPWYVTEYGLGPAKMDIHPSSAAAQRFDQILGTHFFNQIYDRGVDVYGAYPSLHVAYPFLVIWITFGLDHLKWWRIPAILFYLLMCLSAVYLQHHYVVDILLGTSYALITLIIVTRYFDKKESMR